MTAACLHVSHQNRMRSVQATTRASSSTLLFGGRPAKRNTHLKQHLAPAWSATASRKSARTAST